MSPPFSTRLFRSDHLDQFRAQVRYSTGTRYLAGDLPVVILVLDSSVIIAAVRWMVGGRRKSGARSALQEVAASGVAMMVAPQQLRVEVLARLEELVDEDGLPASNLLAAWAELELYIRYLPDNPSNIEIAGPLRDPTDRAFLVAYELVAASGIVTFDKDFAAMGVHASDPVVLIDLRDFARAKSEELGVTTSSIVGLTVLLAMAKAGIATLRKLPPFVSVPLVMLGLLAAWKYRSRIPWKTFGEVLAPMVASFADSRKRSTEAVTRITARLPLESPTDLGKLARAELLLAGGPLSTPALEQAIRARRDCQDRRPLQRRLLDLLRKDSSVVYEKRKWRLRTA